MIPRWKARARKILPDTIVRKLAPLTKFRFSNGFPNIGLIAFVVTKNFLFAIAHFESYRSSNLAIKQYEKALEKLGTDIANRDSKILHLIYGLKQHETLHYFHWALIERMLEVIRPDTVFFHYTYEPQGVYWQKVRSKLCLVPVPPFQYYGVAHLQHFAHKADIVRLLALYNIGGVYLDIDTLVFKSFDDLLSDRRLTVGIERLPGEPGACGLCNAAMVSPKGHGGVRAWLESYKYFRGDAQFYWAEHSVKLSMRLFRRRTDVAVLDSHSFFEINWDEANLFFDPGKAATVRARVAGAYSQHLWENHCMTKLLADFSEPPSGNQSFLAGELSAASTDGSSNAKNVDRLVV